MIGGMYHSAARTVDDARRINAHIKETRRGFIERLAHGKETEGVTAG